MIKRCTSLLIILLSIQIYPLLAQNPDIRALSEKDLFRGDPLTDEGKSVRNQTWEDVSLALLVQDMETAAKTAGLESFSVSIANNAITIIYRDIRFLPNSAEVTPETITRIKKLTGVLQRFSKMRLLVQGHTARLSPEDTDDGVELSTNRARSVAAIIADTEIFLPEQIEAVGRGYYEPVADNSTKEGRALNRRVEISIVGSVADDSTSSMVWWNLLSDTMPPGYTAFLVHNQSVGDIRTTLEGSGFSGLIYAATSDGVGILDNSISFQPDNAPTPESVEHLQTIGSLLLSLDKDAEVRIGGYGADIPKEQIEDRHFLTAYTLGALAGFPPERITFGAAPYILARASADLKAADLTTADGSSVEFEGTESTYTAVVPYAVDSLMINITPKDPLARVSGISPEPISLVPGENEIVAQVDSTARPQEISRTYTLSVLRKRAELQSLTMATTDGSPIAVTPEFSADTLTYRAEVPYEVTDVDISASLLPQDEATGAALHIEKGYSDKLPVGGQEITVSLADGSPDEAVYTLTVIRQPPAKTTLDELSVQTGNGDSLVLSPLFSPDVTTYRATVPYSMNSVSVSVMRTDQLARLEAPTDAVPLTVGENTILTRVATQNGDSVTEYRVIIERASPLLASMTLNTTAKESEVVLVPSFTPEVTEYSASVPFRTTGVQLKAALLPEDIAAGATLEILPDTNDELPVGQSRITVRITDADGKTYTYSIEITREEKKELTFTLGNITLNPEWFVSPAMTFYTGGVGTAVSIGANITITEDSDVPSFVKPARLGIAGQIHSVAGDSIDISSYGGFLSLGYRISTESFFPQEWYFPTAFIPRIETGLTYVTINYDDGAFRKGAAFYLSPAIRTDFVFPGLPDVVFGLDVSYVTHFSSFTVGYVSLGLTVEW